MAILWPNGLTTPPPFSWQGHFGPRNANLSYASTYHRGQDFYGFSTVHAIADGTVVHVGRRSGWAGGGVMVWIQHDGFFSRSLHLAEGSTRVYVGQRVAAGAPIGTMGATNGGGYGMAVHLHLEITPGRWHAYNTGQIDPRAFLEARVGGTASGGGGGVTDPTVPDNTDQSEEDDMRYLKLKGNGRLYQVGPEFINGVDGADGENKAWADAGLPGYTEVARWSFDRILRHHAIPENVVNAAGDVLDDLTGGTRYVRHGSWSRAQKVERLAYLAQK